MRIVTTFNPAHWDLYVRRNLVSMTTLEAELVCYHEGAEPELEGVEWRELDLVPGVLEFQGICSGFPPAQGRFGAQYSYNHDAAKFSKKVYAQCDAAEEAADYLVWLDADVEVLKPFTVDQVAGLLNGKALACYQRERYHSECGVVLWDMRHLATLDFFDAYRSLYDTGKVFTLPGGWHDCWALDAVVQALQVPVENLTVNGGLEVVSQSALGEFVRHDKGMRKHA